MTLTNGPGPDLRPGRPLPGGRDGRPDGGHEARRLAARLAAAQRRLGQVEPAPPRLPSSSVEDLDQITATDEDMRMRGVIRRLIGRRPR